MFFLKLVRESYFFAIQAITSNKLRTILSLSGITIGIFAIITVFTIVDSMGNTIRSSIESLGNNVLFVQKWPWSFGSDYPWWKYMKRPVAKYEDLQEIEKRCSGAEASAFMISLSKTVKYKNNSIQNATIIAVSSNYEKVKTIELADGRYFAPSELSAGRNVAIIGSQISESLFSKDDPLDKDIKIFGQKLKVIGICKKEGESNFGPSMDNVVLLDINFVRNIMDIKFEGFNPTIMVKAKSNVSNAELKDELTGVLRSIHRLKPGAEDDFAINETSLLSAGFESLFSIINIAGWIIGGFSILVGGFGIANIMFVSVKERTGIIGIQKSVGAKNYFILFQFLFEAIILCLIGGLFGLAIIYLGTVIISGMFEISIVLTSSNIILGLTISVVIGVLSGFMPAYAASRLNPVDAIRSNQ